MSDRDSLRAGIERLLAATEKGGTRNYLRKHLRALLDGVDPDALPLEQNAAFFADLEKDHIPIAGAPRYFQKTATQLVAMKERLLAAGWLHDLENDDPDEDTWHFPYDKRDAWPKDVDRNRVYWSLNQAFEKQIALEQGAGKEPGSTPTY